MVCEQCGTVYYSAAARIMVERGERCSTCGGKLALLEGPRGLASGRERGTPPADNAA
jgi:DNA-directed RNA polymerase subunit RPC12/RpoP